MKIRKKAQLFAKIGGGCVATLVCFTGVESASAVSFIVSGPGANDIDTNPATDVSFNVGTSGTIQDLNLGIQLSNSFYTDLNIFLSHNSTTVQVYQGPKNDSSGSFNVTFNDEATNSIPSGGDAVGTFLPFQSLSAFDGQELSGTWTLSFLDTYIPNEGNDLIAWTLSDDSTLASVPFEFSPSLGLLLVGGLFGGTHFYRKYQAGKVVLK